MRPARRRSRRSVFLQRYHVSLRRGFQFNPQRFLIYRE
jgi:hypothetical protein